MSSQQLASLMSREITCLQTLSAILQREYDALLTTDTSELEQIVTEKNQALAAQAESSQARIQFTLQQTGNGTENELQQLIEASGAVKHGLEASFAEITSLARQCQEANRRNGRLISQKQQQAQSALNILRQTDNTPATYSGQGDTTNQQRGRSLGKA